MAEFKISRIRYTWRGAWQTGTSYIKDDVVHYAGSAWVCIRLHSASSFNDDYTYVPVGDTVAQPAWVKMTNGLNFRSNWAGSTVYFLGDVVTYGGRVYLCSAAHTSASDFDTNIGDWTVIAEGQTWTGDWATNTRYGIGDLVRYNGIVYRCTTGHTSAATTALGLEANQFDWSTYYTNYHYAGEWADGTKYKANDYVKYGGSLLRCTTGHVSGESITVANFVTAIPGQLVKGQWSALEYYAEGDVVIHGGYVYRATRNNFSSNPSDSTYEIFISDSGATPDWAIIEKGTNLAGVWSPTTSYKTGDVVQRGGSVYVATLDTTSDGSSLDYLDAGNWELIISGISWKNAWNIGQDYAVGDVVSYRGSAYKANYEHTATAENFPGDNGSGYEYWTLLLQGADNIGMVNPGDLLTYGLSRSLAGDGSTLGATNVPIGNEDELLQVGPNGTLEYDNFGRTQRFFYVDPYHGVDDRDNPSAGIDPFKPVKTIKYATELANDRTGVPTTIKCTTGVYEEILPIIVPKTTAILGDELRSTHIKPKPANPVLADDSQYRFAALNHLKAVCRDIVSNNAVTKTAGNELDQVYVIDSVFTGSYTPAVVGESGVVIIPAQPIYEDVAIYGDTGTADAIDGFVTGMIQYINFHVNSTGDDVDVFGTNTQTTDQADINGGRAIVANDKFLAAEIVAYMRLNYPDYDLPVDLYTDDVRRYVAAFEEDLHWPGNYATILEARYYANQVNGSQLSDMFYVRDATGVRNCTVKGLTGTLNPPNVFEQYQRPTGPSYISLDPGWGPDDERCWITTRSPYIQNVTTFGDNCTGQKIDGALHNGGNKSIVSNDFTQVISDGIGAHVLNNGRAELVSVFTYYAQVGYLSEQGGIIRGTNGNCSYGYIGALADGNDPTETPITATVNTRTEQASIAAAFAGEVNDEILTLEFLNAGQNYTSVEYTFVGSGVNADVIQDEYRDDALFEGRIVTGAASAAAGGGGYTLIGNNAQTGTNTTITLATNDDNEEANLLGLRILITSGEGTGQYGYVSAYNSTTKVVQVKRESDNQPGWDHVIPGYHPSAQLNTSSRYRFEPRLTFDAPLFTQGTVALDAGTAWADVAYGETRFDYLSISGTPGTGTVVDAVASNATFNILKRGRNYTVTVRSPGAGYAVGDVIVIEGTDLGGTTPDNDLTITVLSVSGDSTNGITSIEYSGYAKSGKFVAVSSTGRTSNVSFDGSTWSTVNLPSDGNWISITGGGNRFVTVKNDSNLVAISYDAITWSQRALPVSAKWESVTHGPIRGTTDGVWVAVASDGNNAAYSLDGFNWTAENIPDFGDSTVNEWRAVTYGGNKFVAIASSNNLAAVGTYDPGSGTFSWTTYIMDVIADSSQKDWKRVAYGNNRFVVMGEQGDIGYSFDGQTWFPAEMPTPDGSTKMDWQDLKFGGGVFIATMDTGGKDISGDDPTAGPVDYIWQSYDGIVWEQKDVEDAGNWGRVAFGNPDITADDGGDNRKNVWVLLNRDVTFNHKRFFTGARAKGRCIVEGGRITQIRLWETGSNYTSAGPGYTITDPNNTSDLVLDTTRIADRVLAQPSWINRGNNYKTSTTTVSVLGDGFADTVPVGKFLTVSGMPIVIGPGAQLRLQDNAELYTVVAIERESEEDGTFTLRFRVSPELKIENDVAHNTPVTIRTRYSQVRISNHDFLDIGTGNFTETNYPELYFTSYISYPENEVQEINGGRVFYTSTDQSGNFRCGELFAVEQATGIVTISADFFDLNGLTELALGGIRVGGTGTIIREFSTDPLFTADSNNIVPTQRAIKAYLQNRLNVGGADLLTASFIAGTVRVGPGLIGSTAGLTVNVPVKVDISGPKAGIRGSLLAQQMFTRSFTK